MIYALVRVEGANFPVATLCRCLGVSTSGYYEWRDREPSARTREDAELTASMAKTHKENKERYGRRRHQAELLELTGKSLGPNRVRRLMAKAGLWAKQRRRFVVTTKSDPDKPVAPN